MHVDKTGEATLHPIIEETVVEGSSVYTDEHRAYTGLNMAFDHDAVKHSAGEYDVPVIEGGELPFGFPIGARPDPTIRVSRHRPPPPTRTRPRCAHLIRHAPAGAPSPARRLAVSSARG